MSQFNSIKILFNNLSQQSVDLDVEESIVYPENANIVKDYIWTDHDGNIISTSKSFTHPFNTSNDYGILLNLICSDLNSNFSIILADSIIFDRPDINFVKETFSSSYNISLFNREMSNLDSTRMMTYLPKWASGYRNVLSNYAKLTMPISNTISNIREEVNNICVANINTESFFEYPSEIYRSIIVGDPIYAKLDNEIYENIGQLKFACITNYPFGKVKSIDKSQCVMISKDIESAVNNRLFIGSDSIIYITPKENTTSQKTIQIFGCNSNGDEIHEDIVINNSNTVATKFKYSFIVNIESEINLNVSTYIDCENVFSFTSELLPTKRIVNEDGIYFDPIIKRDNGYIEFVNQNGYMLNTVRRFNIGNYDKIFITNLLDVITLKDKKLYCCKPSLFIDPNIEINSSFNNNDIIDVDNTNPVIGEIVNFTINISKALEIFDSTKIQIQISNGSSTGYVSSNIAYTDSDSWIDLSNRKSNISFGMPIENNNSIIVRVYAYGFSSYLCAGVQVNSLNPIQIYDGIDDIFIYNNKLFGIIDGVNYKINLSRSCFVTNGSYMYTDIDFSNGDIFYD